MGARGGKEARPRPTMLASKPAPGLACFLRILHVTFIIYMGGEGRGVSRRNGEGEGMARWFACLLDNW